ncbi:hypothetical protein LINPERHAP1_LOCUS2171 [Linum perenne]
MINKAYDMEDLRRNGKVGYEELMPPSFQLAICIYSCWVSISTVIYQKSIDGLRN